LSKCVWTKPPSNGELGIFKLSVCLFLSESELVIACLVSSDDELDACICLVQVNMSSVLSTRMFVRFSNDRQVFA